MSGPGAPGKDGRKPSDKRKLSRPPANDKKFFAEPWRRALALAVDAFIIYLAGMGIGVLFRDSLIRVGVVDGNIAGFFLAALYLSILNSNMGDGRSIGKRVFGIRVVGRNGGSISLYRSIFRSLILILPLLINGIIPSFSAIEPQRLPVVSALYSYTTTGLGLSIVYLALFNWRTGQSLHDLLCGTYVVKYKATPRRTGEPETAPVESATENPINAEPIPAKPIAAVPIDAEPVSKFHFFIIFIVTAAAILFPLTVILNTPAEIFVERYNLHKELSALDDAIDQVVLFEGKEERKEPSARGNASKEETTESPEYIQYLEAVLYINKKTDPEGLARKAAETILRTPRYREKDNIIIMIKYGFDIGIASDYESSRFSNPPEAWGYGGK